MKVNNILLGNKISKHLYHFDKNIEPEDFLKVVRFMARKGKDLGYIYNRHDTFYTNSASITKKEFEFVCSHFNESTRYLLERYTRDDLVNRVGSAMRIVSSTTKAEITQTILTSRDLLFRFFKQDCVEKYSSKWQDFKKQKVLLPAASDSTKRLVFGLSCRGMSLSGDPYLQYWRLGNRCDDVQLDRELRTKIGDSNLMINLKDQDDAIVARIRQFLAARDTNHEFDLCCEYRTITADDLNIKKAETISYPLTIHGLAQHFGVRKGSKFDTFSEGMRARRDETTINQYLGRKFVIAANTTDVYSGIEHGKEMFEKIAWNLKLEYLKDKKILCRVVTEETQETIAALWDTVTESMYSGAFYFIETEEDTC